MSDPVDFSQCGFDDGGIPVDDHIFPAPHPGTVNGGGGPRSLPPGRGDEFEDASSMIDAWGL